MIVDTMNGEPTTPVGAKIRSTGAIVIQSAKNRDGIGIGDGNTRDGR